ncbi:MAG: hypothetical protein PHO37_06455 [Kiritimatiellae bacterium]|nr:hypothetical protein [Kiritimatiellia bacterium]
MKLLCKISAVVLVAVSSSYGQSWISGVDGSWGTGANWDGAAVPNGSVNLYFTNTHSGKLTVALDGSRTNAADVIFGSGAWRVASGSPAGSALVLDGERVLTVDSGTVELAAPVTSQGGSKIIKQGAGELSIEAPWDFLSGATPAFEAGVTKVTAEGEILTAANKDLYVDGTAALVLDGGTISTKIVRMGQDVMADGALFRMNSGVVNCSGSGGAVLLIGYTAQGDPGAGSARAEILGGIFAATGAAADGGIFVGTKQPGTLVVNGTNGTPAVVNVGTIWMGWKDSNYNLPNTNTIEIGSNAVVTASQRVLSSQSLRIGNILLQDGGVLRTPDVYADAGTINFDFAGGTLEVLTPNSAGLFRGASVGVAVSAESTLDIGANDVLMRQGLSGAARLNIAGDGTLTFGGDQSGFSGTLARDSGTVLLDNLADAGEMTLALSGSAALITGVNPALELNLVVDGAVSVTSLVESVVISSVELQGGTLTVADGVDLVLEQLQIPAGVTATIHSSGHVVIYTLSGGGTLSVAGGGSFDIIDKSVFDTDGGTLTASSGTTLNSALSVLSELNVWWDITLTPATLLSVSNLNFYGSTLSVAGGGGLAVGDLTVFEGAAAGIELTGGSLVNNIESCAIAVGGVFAINPGAGNTLTVGSLAGDGTFRLDGGVLAVADVASSVHLDINDGSVVLSAPSAPAVPLWTSGEPAFWVDATASESLVTGSNLQWRDKRYSGGIHTMQATATGEQPVILANELNNNSVVKFASPSSSTYKGMVWDQRLTNIRTVFWVIGAQEGGGMLLGDESLLDFLRGELVPSISNFFDYPLNTPYTALFSTRYANANRDNLRDVRDGTTRVNGELYDSFQRGFPTPGYHVISLRTADDTVAKAFASERLSDYNLRSGCQRLGEVLVFTNALSDAEILDTENYLQKKWFGGDVTLASVRLGGASATLSAVGGSVRINTLNLDAPGVDPLRALSNIAKVERIEVGVSGYTVSNATQSALPFSAGELRVRNGCVVTADLSLASAPYIGQLSGSGSVIVHAVADLSVGGIVVAADESLTVTGNGAALLSSFLYAKDALTFNGFDDVLIDRAYAYERTVLGSSSGRISIGTLNAAGVLSISGALDVGVGYLETEPRTLQLQLAEDVALNIQDVYGRGTLTRSGDGSVICAGTLLVDETDFTMSGDVFASIASVNHNYKTLTVNGSGRVPITIYTANGNRTKSLNFVQGAAANIGRLNNNTGGEGRFYLRAADATALQIGTLSFGAAKNMAFPVGQTTTVANLSSLPGSAIYLYGGVLSVTGSVANVDKIVLFNQSGYLSEGLSLPDNTALTLNVFEARANVDATVDLGRNSVLTLNSGVKIETGAKVTFVNGTILLKTDMVSDTALALQGTSVEVAGGATLSSPALEGIGSISVAGGGSISFNESYGFAGAIENQGGSINIDTTRTKVTPSGPVAAPAFWVDASQSGSLVTNGAGKLEWLDKRTVRDGTPGLNKATSLVRMPVIMGGQLNGLPVVDFGTLGTSKTDERGMIWSTRYTDVQAVHWVIGAQNGGGQMLGDWNTGDIDYFRCSDQSSTPFNYGYADYRTPLWSGVRFATRGRIPNILNGETRMNGEILAAPGLTNGFPSAGYHLLSLRAAGPTWAGAFASERVNKDYGHRSGAQRLGEVLIYRRQLLPIEQEQNDAYLSAKWFDRPVPGYRVLDEGLLTLSGSGTFAGALVSASAISAGSGGMYIDGDLMLSYTAAAGVGGTVITVTELPAAGEAVISINGDLTLGDKGTVVFEQVRPGVYTILEPSGSLVGAANLAAWRGEAAAGINGAGMKIELLVEDNALKARITAKGTVIVIR